MRNIGTAVAGACVALLAACTGTQSSDACLVKTASGHLRGVDLGATCAFLGIPFAAPPLGALRWKPPQPAAAWAPATLDAVKPAPHCLALDPDGTGAVRGSENCLTLDLWMPNPPPAPAAPVLVWIDGDDFSAPHRDVDHDGRWLTGHTGAIVVVPNYRTGPFGFLGHAALTAEDPGYPSSANYGLLDQRAAFHWLRGHVAAFGGDPGGSRLPAATPAPTASGCTWCRRRAPAPSRARSCRTGLRRPARGPLPRRKRSAASSPRRWGAAARRPCRRACAPGASTRFLLALPSGQPQFTETMRAAWGPVADGLEVPDQPRRLYERGAFAQVPVMIGTSGDEGWGVVDRAFPGGLSVDVYRAEVETEFGPAQAPAILERYPLGRYRSPKHALAAMVGDVEVVCEARRVARLIERTRARVFVYALDLQANGGPPSARERHGDAALFRVMGASWAQFAATGVPGETAASVVRWPASCDFWDPLFLRSAAGDVPASQP